MCKATRRSLLTLILVAGSMPALAQGPPPSVPFDGTMPEASLIFSLYHAPEEAVLLWVEMQIVAVGPTGAYDTLLGTTSPLPLELFGAGEARWVGVQVEGGGGAGRVLLVSVPYALKAGDADTLGGLPVSAFLRAGALGELGLAPAERVVLVRRSSGKA